MRGERIYIIDFFRFLAAIYVVMYHYTFRGYSADNMSTLSFESIGAYFRYGYLGVDLFFMISGWVILMSIQNSGLIDFIKSRVTRLFPAYWFCLLLTFVIISIWGYPRYEVSLSQLAINATMLNGIIGVPHVDGVYWSLLIELKFYFLISLFIGIRNKLFFTIDHFIWAWLGTTLVLVSLHDIDHIVFKAINYVNITRYSSYFIAGMLLYRILQDKHQKRYYLGLIICYLLSLFQSISHISTIELHYDAKFSAVTIGITIALFYGILLLTSLGRLTSINYKSWFYLGALTYPLYLLHQNIGYIIFNNLGDQFNRYLILIGVISIMILSSYLIFKFIEKPLRALLNNWIKT